MSSKYERILLIDDSDADNFFHRINIENTGLAKNIDCCESAESALNYLRDNIDNRADMPELIFLDINMPAIDGWGFLEKYEATVPPEKRSAKIFVVSTSMNPSDKERAEQHPLVSGYVSKPLDAKTFSTLSTSL